MLSSLITTSNPNKNSDYERGKKCLEEMGRFLAYVVLMVSQVYEVRDKYTEGGTYLQYCTLNMHSFCTCEEVKGDLNKWSYIQCPWVGRLNVIKRAVLFNLIYKFNAIRIRILESYFVDIYQLIPILW